MTVNIEKSVCKDCRWIESCQRLANVNTKETRNDAFIVVIEECGIWNIDRGYS